jgi:hypothetical protein
VLFAAAVLVNEVDEPFVDKSMHAKCKGVPGGV